MTTRPADERRSDRQKVILAATLKHDASQVPVRIMDLSQRGALITGEVLPDVDSLITLRCGTQSVSGFVAWKNGNQAGLGFTYDMKRQPFTSRSGVTSDLVVRDRRVVDFRRPGFRGNQLTREERAFLALMMSDHQIRMAA